MHKMRINFFIFCIHPFLLRAHPFVFDTRIAVGPAWNQFFSYETYNRTPVGVSEVVPDTKFFTTSYNFMPYAENRYRFGIKKYFNTHFCFGGGALNNGFGLIDYLTHDPGDPPLVKPTINQNTRRARVATNVLIVDAAAGPTINCQCDSYIINPLAGYIYNRQNMLFDCIGITTNYCYKTTWKGPYIGIDVSANLSRHISVRAWYKYVIGHVDARIKFSTTQDVLLSLIAPLPDATLTTWKADIRGSIFHFEGVYNWSKLLRLGTGIEYFRYFNKRRTSMKLKSINSDFGSFIGTEIFTQFYDGGTVKRTDWQQVMWTFFMEVYF